MASKTPLLEVNHLDKYFEQSSGLITKLLGDGPEMVKAVDDVSFTLAREQSIGIIGESGCGKTTLLMTLAGLHDPTGGEIRFKGKNVSEFDRKEWKEFRSSVQLIFQDPFNSLDPKFTVEETLREPLMIHGFEDKDRRIRETLEQVELNPPEQFLDRFPDQLSGGEKQRVSIARALVIEPDLILADEPVSMLDVSTQASILSLLSDLIEELGVSMIYISHDLSTVSYICHQIRVMYLGRIVENAPTKQIIDEPRHPYTQALIQAVPIPDPNHKRERTQIDGSPQSPIRLGEGCRFRDRCPEYMDICEKCPMTVDATEDHEVACHLYYDHNGRSQGVEIMDRANSQEAVNETGGDNS